MAAKMGNGDVFSRIILKLESIDTFYLVFSMFRYLCGEDR